MNSPKKIYTRNIARFVFKIMNLARIAFFNYLLPSSSL